MDQFLIEISQKLNLATPLSLVDVIVLFLIVVLFIITFLNIFSDDDITVEVRNKDGKPLEKPEPQTLKVEPIEVGKPEIVEAKIEVVTKPELKESPVVKEVPTKPVLTWDKRLFKGLSKTRSEIWGRVAGLLGTKKLDAEVVEEIEEILFTSDLSPALVDELLDYLKDISGAEEKNYLGEIKEFLKSKMKTTQDFVNTELYKFNAEKSGTTKVIMIVGVNGAGKTTTIGKLATKLKSQGASVVVGACDTFRAAAVEQLEVWCKRAGVEIVKAGEGADPSGVAYDAVAKAKEINADYCIIDTAGRLHTKSNLMDELAKTKKVMSKVIAEAPHETLLVLDAITGQNALRQAEEFNKYLDLSGLIFTKCDGSSKAGSAVSIVQSLQVPIVYIGVGEDVEDLDIFQLDPFLDALLGLSS